MKENIVACPSCNSGWEIIIGKEDFCGWCGSPVKGFEIELDEASEDILCYADEAGPFRFDFKIKNTGLVPIEINEIDIK